MATCRKYHSMKIGALIAPLLALASQATAQEPPITVNPNRPTYATPALTTQLGVAELEFGVQQSFLRASAESFSTPTLLKLGMTRDFEVRLSSAGWLDLSSPGGPFLSGMADLALGAQWCFAHHALAGADWAVQLTHKFATASTTSGLATGRPDDTVALFASRDFGPDHLDVNVLYTWLGLPRKDGGDTTGQPAGAVSLSHRLDGPWSVGGEVYAIGGTPLGGSVASNLWYIAYQPLSRLVLDAGVDIGLSHGAQRYSLIAGLTYGIGRFRRP
jgi:hypothetical protein